MPLARESVFNELNGAEVKQILLQRLQLLLEQVPYLQRHLTLPRVRMTIQIELNCWADQPGSETHRITDDFTVRMESDGQEPVRPADKSYTGYDVVDASPGPASHGHFPPGRIRDDHGIPDAVPVRGPDGVTSDHLLRSSEVPLPPDWGPGRLPSAQKTAVPAALPADPPPAPVTLPGVMVERGRRQTHVTMDRGGPAIGGAHTVPIEELTLRNTGAQPDAEARDEFHQTRATGVSRGNRK